MVVYEFCKLKLVGLNYSIHEKKIDCCDSCFESRKHYLLEVKFKLEIDHKSLKYLLSQPNLSKRQYRWMELLQEFDFEVKYVK